MKKDKRVGTDYYLFRIMLVGNDGVGKTTFFHTLMGEDVNKDEICRVGYKPIWGIADKLMIKIEVSDFPECRAVHGMNN
jgi:septin family protein